MYFVYFISFIIFSCKAIVTSHLKSNNVVTAPTIRFGIKSYSRTSKLQDVEYDTSRPLVSDIETGEMHKNSKSPLFEQKDALAYDINASNLDLEDLDSTCINLSSSFLSFSTTQISDDEETDTSKSVDDLSNMVNIKDIEKKKDYTLGNFHIKRAKSGNYSQDKKGIQEDIVRIFIIVYLLPGLFILIGYCFISSTSWDKIINFAEAHFNNTEALHLQIKRAYEDFIVYLNEKKNGEKCKISTCKCHNDPNEQQMTEMWIYNI